MNVKVKILMLILVFGLFGRVFGENNINFKGMDSPDDKGGAIDTSWTFLNEDLHKKIVKTFVFRKVEGEKEFQRIKELDVSTTSYSDKKTTDAIPTYYKLSFVDIGNKVVYESPVYGPYLSSPQWFKKSKTVTLIFALISIAIILIFIQLAKQGKNLYIRPLPGVKAIEDAVGRATEMGKPCVYIPGISYIEDVSTLASISILSNVSETIAEYNSRMLIPNFDPIVYSVVDEVVKNSYIKAGRPDAYRADDVYYLTGRQFAYASGVAGLMAREKPAANFFLGWFMAESLILAEAGSMTGAIQIAGTDSTSQIPFFIVACDYTLIGEELYAAGAYMGKDAKLLGGLKGQDYVKLLVMATIFILFLLRIFGVPGIETLLAGGN